MSTFLRVLSVYAFLLLVFHIPETEAAEPQLDLCNNTDTSTNTSKSRTNLELLFSSLSSNASQKNWFYRTYIGQDPNNANGRAPALCRICSDCIATAGDEIRSQCSNRSARMWYSICNLRTSRTLVWVYTWNILNVSDPNQFKTFLGNVMSNLTTTAANQVQVATQYPPEADMEIVLGPVLCLRDISAGDCDRCVGNAIAQVPNCCNGEQNRIVIKSFCSTGSKVSSFYDPSAIGDLSPSTPPILAPVPPPENTARPSPAPTDAIPPSTEAARPHNETRTRDNSSRIIPILVPTIAVAIVLFIIIALLLAKKTRKKTCTAAIDGIVDESDESFQIDFDTVRVATNDFSDENKLGEGGFGPVYKGSLSNGQEIAVKRLSRNSGQGVQEFMNEVALVAKLQHKNLVRILGCCVRGEEKLLVYEYVPNRSLDYFLFDPAKREVLNWECRYKIIKGVARGLLHLHEESRLRIIHRDLKAGNILLDADMNPKISDFGMAKIFGEDQTHGNTNRIAGTFGYMSPEYASHGQFSFKSDVFSFGVLLLEIIIGQKNNTFYQTDRGEDILSYVWRAWNNGNVLEIIDPTICEQCSRSEATRSIHIGMLCVQKNATARPLMSSVVVMLNSFSISLPAPSAPAFFVSSVTVLQGNHLDSSRRKSTKISQNDVSISELEPR